MLSASFDVSTLRYSSMVHDCRHHRNTKTQFLKDEVGGKVGAGEATLGPACTVQIVKLPYKKNFKFGKILLHAQYLFVLVVILYF